MKKLYKKGKVHPSLSSSSAIDDQYFSFLPAAILTLIGALSFEDKQILAYLISCSSSSSSSIHNKKNYNYAPKGTKLGVDHAGNHGGGGRDHSPAFNCDCFRCYKSFWARWDASPNRQLIHEIIEAYEEDLMKKQNKLNSNKNLSKVKRDRRRVSRVCDEPRDADVELGSGQGLIKEDIKAEESVAVKVAGEEVTGAGEEAEEDGSEKGSALRRLWGFIGEKVSAVWNLG